jgi:ABC-type multidrug transport system ATPase subunit
MILSTDKLSKRFGHVQALKEVSFSVPEGCVFGILGPNGSGKTTFLGIIMDVIRPTSGSFKLFGEKPTADQRKRMGTLLETPNFYHYLSAYKNLEIAAAIKGIRNPNIDEVLELVNLSQRKHSKFSTYSLGMKQRLAIASSMLGDPPVLVFDEPTNGLDPVGIAEIRSLIKRLNASGKTIIMASHLLDEVEKVCTHVAVLKQGILLGSGPVNEIFATEDVVEIGAPDKDKLGQLLASTGNIAFSEENSLFLLHYNAGTADLAAVNSMCFENGVVLNHLTLKKKSLETKFFELTNK